MILMLQFVLASIINYVKGTGIYYNIRVFNVKEI